MYERTRIAAAARRYGDTSTSTNTTTTNNTTTALHALHRVRSNDSMLPSLNTTSSAINPSTGNSAAGASIASGNQEKMFFFLKSVYLDCFCLKKGVAASTNGKEVIEIFFLFIKFFFLFLDPENGKLEILKFRNNSSIVFCDLDRCTR